MGSRPPESALPASAAGRPGSIVPCFRLSLLIRLARLVAAAAAAAAAGS